MELQPKKKFCAAGSATSSWRSQVNIAKIWFRASRTKLTAIVALLAVFSFSTWSLLPALTFADSGNPNLSINKTVRNITAGEGNWQQSTNANSGDRLAFSIVINSTGSSPAYNVAVTDSLPYQFSYVSGSTRLDGNYTSDGIVGGGVNIGSIYNGQSKTITFEVYTSSSNQYSSGNSVTNYAYVTADSVSQKSDNAQVFINYNNNNPSSTNLYVYNTVRNITSGEGSWQKSTSANYGDRLGFSIVVTTNSNNTAYNVSVSDTLPYPLSYVTGSTRIDGNYTNDNITSGGLFIGSLEDGQSKTVTFEATVSSNYSGNYSGTSNTITNYAYAKADNISQRSDSVQIFLNQNYPYNYNQYPYNQYPYNQYPYNQYPYNQYQYQYGIRTFAVAIRNFGFDPSNLTVRQGDKVVFTNYDSVIHTVSAAAFGGQHIIQPNQSYTLDTSYLQTVQYNYQCDFHPFMTGTILVMAQLPAQQVQQIQQPQQPQQQPQQPQEVKKIYVRAVTGANDISSTGALAAIFSALAMVLLYFGIRNFDWFTKFKLNSYTYFSRLKQKIA